MYVFQNKIGIIMNVGLIVKNQITGFFAKSFICGILARVIMNVMKHVKLKKIGMLKIVPAKTFN